MYYKLYDKAYKNNTKLKKTLKRKKEENILTGTLQEITKNKKSNKQHEICRDSKQHNIDIKKIYIRVKEKHSQLEELDQIPANTEQAKNKQNAERKTSDHRTKDS